MAARPTFHILGAISHGLIKAHVFQPILTSCSRHVFITINMCQPSGIGIPPSVFASKLQ